MLSLDQQLSATLGGLISLETAGNPSYIVEFLRWLEQSNLLTYDEALGVWSWDDKGIRVTVEARESAAKSCFITERLKHLSLQCQVVLKVAACLGFSVDESILQLVLEYPVSPMIQESVAMNLLVPDVGHGGNAFSHDGIQTAAYNLIPEEGKELFHVEIGRRLWRKLDEKSLGCLTASR